MTFSLNADMLPAQDFPPVRTLSTPESGFFNKPPDSSNSWFPYLSSGPWMGWCGMEPPVTEVNSWASWALGEYLYRPTRRS